ncbi:MAG: hypothetical protein WAK03_02490 [Methylocystis sp.]|jgi:hypothetical protein
MKKKALAPEQQGHIDGMCAVYAVVNGCKLLFDHSETMDLRLFKELCHDNADLFPKIVYAGAETPGLKRFLRTAANWSLRVHHKELSFTRISQHKKFRSVEPFFENLRMAMAPRPGEKTVAILGIDKPWDHWTVARSVGVRRVSFFDSWGFPAWTAFDYFTFNPEFAGSRDDQKSLLAWRQTFILRAPVSTDFKRNPENTGS